MNLIRISQVVNGCNLTIFPFILVDDGFPTGFAYDRPDTFIWRMLHGQFDGMEGWIRCVMREDFGMGWDGDD